MSEKLTRTLRPFPSGGSQLTVAQKQPEFSVPLACGIHLCKLDRSPFGMIFTCPKCDESAFMVITHKGLILTTLHYAN